MLKRSKGQWKWKLVATLTLSHGILVCYSTQVENHWLKETKSSFITKPKIGLKGSFSQSTTLLSYQGTKPNPFPRLMISSTQRWSCRRVWPRPRTPSRASTRGWLMVIHYRRSHLMWSFWAKPKVIPLTEW